MAEGRSDPFQRRARDAGPLEPGRYRVVPSDHPENTHDFSDLEAARQYADDVASEADYEDVPPTAFIYDSSFERIEQGKHYAVRAVDAKKGFSPGRPAAQQHTASSPGLSARIMALLNSFFGRR